MIMSSQLSRLHYDSIKSKNGLSLIQIYVQFIIKTIFTGVTQIFKEINLRGTILLIQLSHCHYEL